MKKGFYAILAALTVFALVITGCPPDGGDGGGDTRSNVTTLTRIQIGNGTGSVSTTNRNASIDAITPAVVPVSSLYAADAEITLTYPNSFKGSIKIAVKATTPGSGDFTIDAGTWETHPNLNPKVKAKVADGFTGYKVYVQMTAENGKVEYYGYTVEVGTDASLKEEGGILFDDIPVDTLGSPKSTVALIDADKASWGKIQFRKGQPDGGYTLNLGANDPQATVTIAIGNTNTTVNESSFKPAGDVPVPFNEGDFLYIKVVSENGNVTNIYKIEVIIKRTINIPYGTVKDLDITDDGLSEDTAWDAVQKFTPIDRPNETEGDAWVTTPKADQTHGQVKLMWDEDGIWVYAQVWEKHVTANATEGTEHNASSVEVFVNEAYPTVTTGAVTGNDPYGGQYRLGADGTTSGAPAAAVTLFNDLDKYSAKKITTMPTSPWGSDTSITSGYVLVFQVPWRYPDLYAIDEENKEISLELQINAVGADGNRTSSGGVLNWNNTSSNCYSDLSGFGGATLRLEPGQTLGPQRPVIKTQPAGYRIPLNDPLTALTVTAAAPGTGATLSYKWYKADDADGANATEVGTNAATYTPVVSNSVVGEFFYYVVVSNTVAGKDPKTIRSAVAKVTVYDPTVGAQDKELISASTPGWNDSEGGVVKTGVSQWGDLLVFDAMNVADYNRLEVVFDAFDPSGNAVVPTAFNITRINVDGVDWGGSNASGVVQPQGASQAIGVFFTFDDAMKAKSEVVIKFQTKVANYKYVIKSAKLIVAAP